MLTKIVVFIYTYPVVTFAVLAVLGILIWFLGYRTGNKDGHVEQHAQEVDILCGKEKVEFPIANRFGDTWMVTSILQRRGHIPNHGERDNAK